MRSRIQYLALVTKCKITASVYNINPSRHSRDHSALCSISPNTRWPPQEVTSFQPERGSQSACRLQNAGCCNAEWSKILKCFLWMTLEVLMQWDCEARNVQNSSQRSCYFPLYNYWSVKYSPYFHYHMPLSNTHLCLWVVSNLFLPIT